jgi:hypothetical protein
LSVVEVLNDGIHAPTLLSELWSTWSLIGAILRFLLPRPERAVAGMSHQINRGSTWQPLRHRSSHAFDSTMACRRRKRIISRDDLRTIFRPSV